MAVIFVTHDLGVVADICDRVTVLYAGQVVEMAEVHELFRRPRAPVHRGTPRRDAAAPPRRRRPGLDPRPRPAARPACPTGAGSTPAAAYAVDGVCTATPIALEAATDGRSSAACATPSSTSRRARRPSARRSRRRERPITTATTRSSRRRGLTKHFPIRKGILRRVARRTRAPSTASTSRSSPARPSASSASRDRGSRRSVAASSGCSRSTAASCASPGSDVTTASRTRAARRSPQRADDLPGPVLVVRPARHRRLEHRRAARAHEHMSRRERDDRAAELVELVGLGRQHLAAVPVRVLRRAAPAPRDRARARDQPAARRVRRTGELARRVDPGPGHQPHAAACNATSASRTSSSRTTSPSSAT